MRGTANEASLLEFLKQLLLVAVQYEAGVLLQVQQPHFSCSSDVVVPIKADSSLTSLLEGPDDILFSDVTLKMEPVQIEAKLKASTVGDSQSYAYTKFVFWDLGDEECL